ncbi:MAG: YIP1 family protein [Paracoccaceae bacterium]|nr:YIP1 family protein [Paracoccaceae bacterium]
MAVTTEILATYRAPGRVMARLMSDGPREDRALAILLGACFVMFIATWPNASREAILTGQEPQMLMAARLFGVVFVLPLVFYVVALISHGLLRLFGGKSTGYKARMALFWALLAASPLALLVGLVGGFIGPGLQLRLTGAVWFAAFAWFWIAGLRQAGWGETR